jgi:hypothetical protein
MEEIKKLKLWGYLDIYVDSLKGQKRVKKNNCCVEVEVIIEGDNIREDRHLGMSIGNMYNSNGLFSIFFPIQRIVYN